VCREELAQTCPPDILTKKVARSYVLVARRELNKVTNKPKWPSSSQQRPTFATIAYRETLMNWLLCPIHNNHRTFQNLSIVIFLRALFYAVFVSFARLLKDGLGSAVVGYLKPCFLYPVTATLHLYQISINHCNFIPVILSFDESLQVQLPHLLQKARSGHSVATWRVEICNEALHFRQLTITISSSTICWPVNWAWVWFFPHLWSSLIVGVI
jgi:hypothetical protein